MPTEQELIAERVRKTEELRKIGLNPYPHKFVPTHHANELIQKYQTLKPEEKTPNTITVAGRIIALRRMGKVTFMHVLDETEKIQLWFKQDLLQEQPYAVLKLFDIGDFIGAKGIICKTKQEN